MAELPWFALSVVFEKTIDYLTHFQPMFHFYTPWKHQKSLIFIPIFSWTISHQLNIKSYQYRKFEQALFENVA